MRRIFNFADNRVANLTAEVQNAMHTRMRGKAALLFRRQATENTLGMMGERNLIERERATNGSRGENSPKKDAALWP